MSGDFSVSVGIDFSETLQGFKQLEQEAQKTGQVIGDRFDAGVRKFSTTSLAGLQAELSRLQQRQTTVGIDTKAFEALGVRIREVQGQLEQVQRKQTTIGIDDRSLVVLQSRLSELQAKQTRLDVDSSEFATVTQEISRVQQQLSAVERKKLLINADPNSIVALNAKLGELQQELNQVQIGSQRFKELQQAVKETERELQKAGQSVDGFNLIDGAIQGLAFSLTNTVTNAIGSAVQSIQGLISGFAELDTEIRQAAAASGEAGAYDKLARSIDQVGIDAAGTTLEVAKLNTELIRGGMTVDQANASLGAIVRGAEATGTGFAEMGSVVSASLKGFGLQATDAKRVVDALVTGANASATSVGGMGEAFKYAAPVAKILGVSVEELGIAVGLLTNAGITASEAGVTLRNGLSKLASAAPQAGGGVSKLTGQAKMAADTMKQLGINIYNADGTLQPMETTLLKLKGAFDKLGPSSKIRLAANLFGGEDDGTKWLALLSQSESEIKKMSATMANTKGATDTARNAMQGFEMAMKSLDGTIGSIRDTIGKVAATVLLPLVNAVSAVVGAIAGLPDPVKNTAAALILMAGAAVTATAALVIYNRTMEITKVQTAATEIVKLAGTFKETLGGAIRAAAAVVPMLIAQLSALATTQYTFMGVVTGAATALRTGFVSAVGAAADGLLVFIKYLASANFASFIAGARAAVLALAPLALTAGAVAALVGTWQYVLGGAAKVTEDFAGAQKEADEAVAGLGKAVNQAASDFKPASRGILSGFRAIREELTMLRAMQEMEDLQGSFTKVQMSALGFLNTVKDLRSLTPDQIAQSKAYSTALGKIGDAAKAKAAGLRASAEEAERASNPSLAAQFREQADVLDIEEQTSRRLVKALEQQAAKTQAAAQAAGEQVILTKEQAKAVEERTKAEQDLNRTLRDASLDRRLAVGQQLLGLTKAVGDLEQSRFGVARSALQFQLSQLEKIGASDVAIAQKRAEIERVESSALAAKFRALTQQQKLEEAILRINQEKARIDADSTVDELRLKRLGVERDLAEETDAYKKDKIQAELKLIDAQISGAERRASLLQQTQPLERASAAAQGEAARSALVNEAAGKGIAVAADGTLVKTRQINELERARIVQANELLSINRQFQSAALRPQVDALGRQTELGQQLLNYSKALGDLEQSRFSIVRSRLEFELSQLQARGASEGTIAAKRAQIDALDRQSLSARYAALLKQQELEGAILQINQQKAALDARIEFLQQRGKLLQAEFNLQQSLESGNQVKIAQALLQYNQERQLLDAQREKAALLARVQPIESAIAAATSETARNNLQSEAAAKGYNIAAVGTLANLGGVTLEAQNLADLTGQAAEGQNAFRQAAEAAGLSVQEAADGTLTLGKNLDFTGRSAGGIQKGLEGASNPAKALEGAFTKTGDAAPRIVQGSRDFAAYLSGAKGSGQAIENLSLDTKFRSVAGSMGTAAGSAREFYAWLKQAAALPGSRWTGGPVEAGGEYRINELGQEAFLSAGRLSLINAAPNSIWRAPASGVVIPAGVTARLQDTAALAAGGGGPVGVAELAIEVGKLRQEVGELARRNWDIHVQHRTGPTASQVMNQIHRLR